MEAWGANAARGRHNSVWSLKALSFLSPSKTFLFLELLYKACYCNGAFTSISIYLSDSFIGKYSTLNLEILFYLPTTILLCHFIPPFSSLSKTLEKKIFCIHLQRINKPNLFSVYFRKLEAHQMLQMLSSSNGHQPLQQGNLY